MRDFTLAKYNTMLLALKECGYRCISFHDSLKCFDEFQEKFVVIRHDVDKRPLNSVRMAEMEAGHGMLGTYYFRIVPGAWDPEAIRQIGNLGHECGYHYEDLDLSCGDLDRAYQLFEKHLLMLRDIVRVDTICMHGSPMSRWDNRDMWRRDVEGQIAKGADSLGIEMHRRRHYRDFGVTGEPYFDIDFEKVGYVTDTGRSWNNREASIRDKVDSSFNFQFHNTTELILAIREGRMPEKMMITIHPQRWDDALIPWTKELVGQSLKNVVKRALIARRKG